MSSNIYKKWHPHKKEKPTKPLHGLVDVSIPKLTASTINLGNFREKSS